MTTEKEDSFAAMFEQQPVAPRKRRAIRIGDRLDAIVIQVGRDAVFVELDGKQQAFLEAAELRDDDGTMSVKVGDKLSANVVEINDEQGVVRLGRSLGKPGSVAALEMAKSATEWARKMPMLVGIIYGLTFQALALSKMGRHEEAITAIDEAVVHLEGARPEGAEHVHRWRSEILAAAGRTADAKAALTRAESEVQAKAAKLRDPELRRHFLASRQRAV